MKKIITLLLFVVYVIGCTKERDSRKDKDVPPPFDPAAILIFTDWPQPSYQVKVGDTVTAGVFLATLSIQAIDTFDVYVPKSIQVANTISGINAAAIVFQSISQSSLGNNHVDSASVNPGLSFWTDDPRVEQGKDWYLLRKKGPIILFKLTAANRNPVQKNTKYRMLVRGVQVGVDSFFSKRYIVPKNDSTIFLHIDN